MELNLYRLDVADGRLRARSYLLGKHSFLCTIQDVRKGFTLCIKSSLVAADTLHGPVTSPLHCKLPTYPRLVRSAGCCCSQGMVHHVVFDASQLAKTSNSFGKSNVPEWIL